MYVSGAYEHQWAPACTCRYLAGVQVGGCVAWGTVSGGHSSSLCWSWLSRCLKFSIAWGGGGGGGGGGAPLPACGCGCVGVGVKWMGIRVPERQLDGFLRPVTDQDRDLTRPISSCKLVIATKPLQSDYFLCWSDANPQAWILVVREMSLILLLGQDVAEDIEAPLFPLRSLPALLAAF